MMGGCCLCVVVFHYMFVNVLTTSRHIPTVAYNNCMSIVGINIPYRYRCRVIYYLKDVIFNMLQKRHVLHSKLLSIDAY